MFFLYFILWNAKLTENQIFSELYIQIESSLFKCEFSDSTYPIRELTILIFELCNWIGVWELSICIGELVLGFQLQRSLLNYQNSELSWSILN